MTIDEKDWRKLCTMATVESDPSRLLAIIEQLIEVLDERRDQMRRSESGYDATSSAGTSDD
jgi:hypothetical protein